MLVDLDELITPIQVAEMLGVSTRRVRQLCAAGELRHVTTPLLGGSRLIPRAAALDFARGRGIVVPDELAA